MLTGFEPWEGALPCPPPQKGTMDEGLRTRPMHLRGLGAPTTLVLPEAPLLGTAQMEVAPGGK